MNRVVVTDFFRSLQDSICTSLEQADGNGRFHEDIWKHESGGGGATRTIQEGGVFEKGGVSTSAVRGSLTGVLATRLEVSPQAFFAAGISLVLHPLSPMMPTVHTNFRYLELENGDFWFGGGADLTPYYLFDEDAIHFHQTWKQACDIHDSALYARFKAGCDEYFFLRHRGEARGIGGIFFDYLRGDFSRNFDLVKTCGNAFTKSYLPIVERRRREPWGDRERNWQLHRRGRYVEFNLIYDRGTLFGLETRGRVESILMSLPPLVRWTYDFRPEVGSREERLLTVLKQPRIWVE
ncbi:MAG: oxygen-dependent coproporphyrinogen oxidase [Ignavibacteriales bacterium]|nr:oxygen-dependent coproporphyrinogen oxidase [Ignavibacteriales bacterium]